MLQLEFEVDDMTGEELGLLMEKALDEGALDINYSSVYMKKNRPGVHVSILLNKDDFKKITKCIFLNSTTIGFRYKSVNRITMTRKIALKKTALGLVREKISEFGDIKKSKLEYEDVKEVKLEEQV